MATLSQTPGVRRPDLLREGWQRASAYAGRVGGYAAQAHAYTATARGHASRAFGRSFDFLVTYPPLAQGVYFLLAGLVPLLAPGLYQTVTGHHADAALLRAFAVLPLAVGGALCLAAYRRQWPPELLLVALGSALGFAALDLALLLRGPSAVHLLDGVLQVGFLVLWVAAWRRARQAAALPPPPSP
jgi:hypothetical protein